MQLRHRNVLCLGFQYKNFYLKNTICHRVRVAVQVYFKCDIWQKTERNGGKKSFCVQVVLFNHRLCLRVARFLPAQKPFPSFHSLLRDSILLSHAERRHWATSSRLWLPGGGQRRGFYRLCAKISTAAHTVHTASRFNIIYLDHLAWDAATVEPVDKRSLFEFPSSMRMNYWSFFVLVDQ